MSDTDSMISLKELAATGASGGIAVGRSRDEVIEALGEPPDRSVTRRPEILKYGPLQVTFGDGKVTLIAYYNAGEEHHGVEVDLPRSRDLLEDALKEAGAQLIEQPALTFDGQVAYTVLPSGATVLFADGRLHSVQLGARSI